MTLSTILELYFRIFVLFSTMWSPHCGHNVDFTLCLFEICVIHKNVVTCCQAKKKLKLTHSVFLFEQPVSKYRLCITELRAQTLPRHY